MEQIACIVIVGKPGAGKSTIGSLLAQRLEGSYLSLGSFMREVLAIPDPHIGVDKTPVYEKLHQHLNDSGTARMLVFDCHPYPESDLLALKAFFDKPQIDLAAVIEVFADDHIALERLENRPRPGQGNADRLKYFNDYQHLINRLLELGPAMRVQNSINDEKALERIVHDIVSRLRTDDAS